MKHRIVALLLAFIIATSSVACSKTEDAEITYVTVSVGHPVTGSISVATDFVGTVAPEDEVSVYPLVSGTVTKTNYEVGDTVKKGDVLFTIDDTSAKLQLDSANASLGQAQAGVAASEAQLAASEAQSAASEASNQLAMTSSRDVANLSTQQNLQQIRKTIDNYDDAADTTHDQIEKLENNINNLKAAAEAASAATSALESQYSASVTAFTASQAAYEAARKAAAANSSDTSLKDKENVAKIEMDTAQANMNKLKEQLDSARTKSTAANSSYSSATSSIDSLYASERQSELTADTYRDQLRLAEQQDQVNRNEVYAQQDQIYEQQNAASKANVAATEAGLNASEATLEAASVGVETAKNALSYYSVKAPISGTIQSVTVSTNKMAQQGATAYVISNKDNMEVTFNVTEAVAKALEVGDAITASRGDETFDGTITEIGGMAESSTKLFKVKASLGAVEGLASGISVKVTAKTQEASDVITVPYDAVYFKGGDTYIFVKEGDTAIRRAITVGLMDDEKVEVVDGLGVDDEIIVTWSSQLTDGSLVKVADAKGTNTDDADGKKEDATSDEKQDDAASDEKQDDAASDDKKDDAASDEKKDDAASGDKKDDAASGDKKDDAASGDKKDNNGNTSDSSSKDQSNTSSESEAQ